MTTSNRAGRFHATTLLLFIFFLQLFLLPSRLYLAIWTFFWPFTHNIILLGLILMMCIARNRPQLRSREGALRVTVLGLGCLFTVQSLCLAMNINTLRRDPIDYLIYFIAFYCPMIAGAVGFYAVPTSKHLKSVMLVFSLVVFLCCLVSWMFPVSDSLFGFIDAAQSKKYYMYRLLIPRIGPTGLGLLCSVTLPLMFSLYLT